MLGRFRFEVARDAYAASYPPPQSRDEVITNARRLWPNVSRRLVRAFVEELMRG